MTVNPAAALLWAGSLAFLMLMLAGVALGFRDLLRGLLTCRLDGLSLLTFLLCSLVLAGIALAVYVLLLVDFD